MIFCRRRMPRASSPVDATRYLEPLLYEILTEGVTDLRFVVHHQHGDRSILQGHAGSSKWDSATAPAPADSRR